MVDISGHVAMGLLWALPAWFVWTRRVTLGFLAVVVVAALTPDVDLWLSALFPASVHHHGVTHTIVFIVALSAVVGAIAVPFTRRIDRWSRNERFTARRTFVFASSAFLVGGFSHLFADLLSSPDVASPLEPFWPFIDQPLIIDVIWYNNPVWNFGLLFAAILLHLVTAIVINPKDPSSPSTDV